MLLRSYLLHDWLLFLPELKPSLMLYRWIRLYLLVHLKIRIRCSACHLSILIVYEPVWLLLLLFQMLLILWLYLIHLLCWNRLKLIRLIDLWLLMFWVICLRFDNCKFFVDLLIFMRLIDLWLHILWVIGLRFNKS